MLASLARLDVASKPVQAVLLLARDGVIRRCDGAAALSGHSGDVNRG